MLPQAMLTDIDFIDNGDMVVGFTDRAGHQLGYNNRGTTGTALYNGYVGGDILRLGQSGATWTLESNGTVSGVTGKAGNAQGPGNGEFYYEEIYPQTGTVIHQETYMGSSAYVPGYSEIAATVMDPVNVFTGGFSWFSNTNGTSNRQYEVYASTSDGSTFGKANGLGAIAVGCDPAPIEIGNRVWQDTDNDGIQDPGEPGISGVKVDLCLASAPTTVIASATTDANGNYYFSTATGTSTGSVKYGLALTNNTDYILKFPTTASGGKTITVKDANGNGSDLIDSDAGPDGKVAFTTGGPGENEHKYDVGYGVCVPPTRLVTITDPTCTTAGNIALTSTNGDKYGFNKGNTYTGPAYATATAVPGTLPAIIKNNISNLADSSFTIRVFNKADGCFKDTTVTVKAAPVKPTLAINQGFPVCRENGTKYTIKFTATGGTVTTVPSLAVTGDSISVPIATASVKLIITSAGGCKDSVTVTAPVCDKPVGSIGDYVFKDANKNGKQDTGETGVNGVKVILYGSNAAGTPGAKLDSTTTAGAGVNAGKYLFPNLLAGDYVVQFVKSSLPDTCSAFTARDTTGVAGITDANDSDADKVTGFTGKVTLAPVFLNGGSTPADSLATNNLTVDAGLLSTPILGSIGDYVFKDANKNGKQDAGETGVNGVKIILYSSNAAGTPGAKLDSATTANGGKYLFPNLPAGDYVVQFVKATIPPDCDGFTAKDTTGVAGITDANDSDADKVTGFTGKVTLAPKVLGPGSTPADSLATNNLTVDAGLLPKVTPFGSLGDFVWKDTNDNGKQDPGEPGVKDVKLKLLDKDGKYVATGMLSGSQEVPPVVTSATGYVKTALDTTTNQLMVSIQYSGLSGAPQAGHIHVGNPGANGPVKVPFTGLPATTSGTYTATVALTDSLKLAYMNNALYVNLHTAANPNGELRAQLNACAITDSQGKYTFANLDSSSYRVLVDKTSLPDSCQISTKPNQAGVADSLDSDFSPVSGISDAVTVDPKDPAKKAITTVDLALYTPLTPLGSIGDYVFKDKNDNGLQDAGDVPISGVKLNLYAAANGTKTGPVLASDTTDATGKYLFANLTAGNYIVEIDKTTLPDTCQITVKKDVNANGNDKTDSDFDATTGLSQVVTLAPKVLGAGSTPADSLATNNPTVDAGLVNKPANTVDLALDKSIDKKLAMLGDTVTYTIRVYNQSLVNATGVEVTDSLAAGLQFVSSTRRLQPGHENLDGGQRGRRRYGHFGHQGENCGDGRCVQHGPDQQRERAGHRQHAGEQHRRRGRHRPRVLHGADPAVPRPGLRGYADRPGPVHGRGVVPQGRGWSTRASGYGQLLYRRRDGTWDLRIYFHLDLGHLSGGGLLPGNRGGGRLLPGAGLRTVHGDEEEEVSETE